MKRTIIFDFDGTLVDSLPTLIELYNEIAPLFNTKIIQRQDIQRFQTIPLKTVFKELNLSHWKLPLILFLVKRKFRKKIYTIQMIEGMKDILFVLKENGFDLGVVTSNSKKNIQAFLTKNQLVDQFSFIHSAKKFYGKSDTLHQVMKTYGLKKETTWYIGDEIKDIEACKKVELPIIAVSWGAYLSSSLQAYHPDYMAHLPHDILDILQIEKKIVS